MNHDTPPASGESSTPHQLGRTLLPGPFAQAVSLATRSTCLAIKLGSAAGSFGLGAARVTTVSSLELARTLVEGVLSRAGRDTLSRSGSDLAAMDAESVIEQSLESLHHAMTQVVFWTTAGFHLTSTAVSMASEVSQIFLSSLDQVLGSTDSSRAIASIVTLIRREFRDPNTGTGDKVGVMDLVLGLCALAYLQQRCWRSSIEEQRRQAYEEIIWDVVVLSDGERIDVAGQALQTMSQADIDNSHSLMGNDSIIKSRLAQAHISDDINEEDAVLRQLKDSIVASLPPDTTVSILNTVSTTQTITVDVSGREQVSLPTPQGAKVIETETSRASCSPSRVQSAQRYDGQGEPFYKVVYRLEKTRTGNTLFRGSDEPSQSSVVELMDFEPPTPETPDQEELKEQPDAPVRAKSPVVKSPTGDTLTSIGSSTKKSLRGSAPLITGSTRRSSSQNGNVAKPQSTTAASRPATPPIRFSSTEYKQRPEREANQKKPRTPLNPIGSGNKPELSRQDGAPKKKALSKRRPDTMVSNKSTDRKGSLKQALKEGSQSLSNIFKDSTVTDTKPQARWRTPGAKSPPLSPGYPKPSMSSKQTPTTSSNPRHTLTEHAALPPRSSSRSSFVSVRERRRDSIVSQTDTYTIHSAGGLRPPSPGFAWTEGYTGSPVTPSFHDGATLRPSTPTSARSHRRLTSHVPSLCSLASNDSQSSLVLSSYFQKKSAYSATDALSILRQEGAVEGIFPRAHVLQNITRYMRFSSASYGSNFLKMMGISKDAPILETSDGLHNDVRHFIHHTASDTSSILLASFVDPQGGTDSSGSTGTGMPLVHYIALDHHAKAVVLACRGTLGFEDVLADMTCDYDTLTWRGRPYKVHKGVHASARRLLYGGDGRVLVTLREALLEFPEYGVVLCGHSLGGAVTALLGVMLAEPNPHGTGFVTTSSVHYRQLGSRPGDGPAQPTLPSGRPIHVYAYGPPGTMSTSLRTLTRGLITSVVHGNDLVPYLSLGVLHDFQAVALAFKQDQHQAKVEIRQHLWQALQGGITDKWYHKAPRDPAQDEYEWGLSVLDALRASTTNMKLMPPGEVFAVESQRVLRRDAFLLQDEDHIGKPAQRIVLKYVKDVEARFKEVRFGATMLVDHSPAKYEEALDKLRLGVSE